jgi:O-antigen/teichoic acid export membrane protein
MNIRIKAILNKLGIDEAILFTVISRIIQGAGGILSIVIVVKYLNKVEQGYFYTFSSILAIQVFFELGLSSIITQFVAHEFANLKWISPTKYDGSDVSMSRLSSILHFCVKWFSIVSVFLFIILVACGFMFFNKYGSQKEDINWLTPWVIISITTAVSLIFSPILSFLEGLGKVKDVAKIRFIQQSSQIIFLFVFLISGLKLYSSPLSSAITLLIVPVYLIFSDNKKLLFYTWRLLKEWKVNYINEIFPFQWRIALSWISGYFMYQLFNPVIFATEGPVVAGQMGVTLTVLNGILALSLSWINTKVPLFSNLIAKKEFYLLDSIFNKSVKQSSFMCFLCITILVFGVFLMTNFGISLGNRFLPMFPLILLSLTTLVNQFISSLATYLRCHKKEPFMMFSIVMGIMTATSTIVLGKFYGLMGITVGYSFLTIFASLIWALSIFHNKKKLWH